MPRAPHRQITAPCPPGCLRPRLACRLRRGHGFTSGTWPARSRQHQHRMPSTWPPPRASWCRPGVVVVSSLCRRGVGAAAGGAGMSAARSMQTAGAPAGATVDGGQQFVAELHGLAQPCRHGHRRRTWLCGRCRHGPHRAWRGSGIAASLMTA